MPPRSQVYERYNESLVQLSDDGLKEMYINFMLIYTGAYTDEVLERCGIPAVTEQVLGFAEMGTMRLGSLLDQPRMVRMQSVKNEKKRREASQASGQKKKQDEERRAALLAKVLKANENAYAKLLPTLEKLAAGEGDKSQVKRYGRRQELQLMNMPPGELKNRTRPPPEPASAPRRSQPASESRRRPGVARCAQASLRTSGRS